MSGQPPETQEHAPSTHPPGSPTRPPRGSRAWMVAFLVSAFVLALFGGVTVFRGLQGPGPQSFVEIYVTDLPADFSRLDVRVAGVYVGEAKHPLTVERPNFNLLALQGPADALRVARGLVPVGDHQEVRIVFESARAELDHKRIVAEIPDEELVIAHNFGLGSAAPHALLFDIDVNESLSIEGPDLMFRPTVAGIYIHAFGGLGDDAPATSEAPPSTAPDFTSAPPEKPRDQRLAQPDATTQPRSPWTTQPSPEPVPDYSTYRKTYHYHNDTHQNGTSDPTQNPQNDTDGTSAEEALPTVGDAQSVPEDYARTIVGWFVQFVPEVDDPQKIQETLDEYQAEVLYRFESVDAVYIQTTPPNAEEIYYDANVTWLEPDLPVDLLLASSKQAIRLPAVQHAVTGLRDSGGNPIDGRGIGVAVVDSGIDGLHPDLPHLMVADEASPSPIVFNFKVESIALHDQVYTDTTSGHGTHVAGIIAGQGAKDPTQRGIAPKALLYGFGIGEVSTMLWPNQAFDWILTKPDEQHPPIRIVSNSWGSIGPYDPNSLTTKLVNQMVAKGIVVVFAAGNEPTPLGEDTTTRECKIPTPGVICVGWYDDLNLGSRSGGIGDKASHGANSDPATWPDLVAPGTAIRSTRTPFGWVSGVGLLDYYVVLKGSSMAAPHVSATVALMLQANGNLSPAQVESILESTAYRFPGAVYVNGAHPARGAGLLDAYAAVATAKTTAAG